MRSFVLVVAVAVLGVALVFTSAACGGGGGGNGGPVLNELNGTYFAVAYEGEIGPPLDNDALFGVITADGLGNFTGGALAANSAGTLIGPLPVPASTYTIGAGRRVTWNLATGPIGGVSADGRVATFTTTATGIPPAATIFLRRAGTFTQADLAGDWHVCAFFTPIGVDSTWFGGTATFDAAGNAMVATGVNSSGAITPPGAPFALGTAVVAADGAITWTTSLPQIVFAGGMLAGGELAVFAGTTQATDAQFLVVLIRQGAGLSAATLGGNYHVTVLGARTATPPRYSSITGTSTANGAGSWTFQGGTGNEDGVISVGGALPTIPYTVAANGALTMGPGGLPGGVSASGNFAMFAGGVTAGDNPTFWFLHR